MRGAQSIQTQPSFGVKRTTGVAQPRLLLFSFYPNDYGIL